MGACNWGEDLRAIHSFCMAVTLVATLAPSAVHAQEPIGGRREPSQEQPLLFGADDPSPRFRLYAALLLSEDPQQPAATSDGKPSEGRPSDGKSSLPDAPAPATNSANQPDANEQYGKQPKRILGIIPNYRAVSANTELPPLSFKGAMWLASQDTFDYSNFIFVAGLAGISMAGNSQPSFGHGAEAYGKYYWHSFVDGAIENYMTEAIVPTLSREDPRYYTLGKGGFVKRTSYAVSRLFITRTNGGGSTFNLSEVVGAGASAGIGNLYYPAEHNPWVKTYQRWGTQVGLDGVFNALKEFWPDIDRAVFHGKY